MTVAQQQLELPAAYELLTFEKVDNTRMKAIELAQQGADEGTLIWAKKQTNGRGRLDKIWHSSDGDLHCAIILKPEFALEQFAQIMVVATVSLAHALATHLSAMTALELSWPNDINIAGHKVAAVWLDASGVGGSPWLTVTVCVNILSAPEDLSIAAISINDAEGKTDLDAQLCLQTFAKQFITQINNWAEHGMAYMMRQWQIRGPDVDEVIRIYLRDEEIVGAIDRIDDQGNVTLRLEDNAVREISLMQGAELETAKV